MADPLPLLGLAWLVDERGSVRSVDVEEYVALGPQDLAGKHVYLSLETAAREAMRLRPAR